MSADDKKSKSPFAALAGLRDALPKGPRQQEGLTRAESAAQFEDKVTVARSNKGVGGKIMTTIAGVRPEAREPLAQQLRRTFGCTTSVEGELIAVHADEMPRVRAFLETRGVRKVIVETAKQRDPE